VLRHDKEDWNLVSRTIMPLIWQPASTPFEEGQSLGLFDPGRHRPSL
jgi:hypothetical protein